MWLSNCDFRENRSSERRTLLKDVNGNVICTFNIFGPSGIMFGTADVDKNLLNNYYFNRIHSVVYLIFSKKVYSVVTQLNQSRYRPGVAQRVPGSLGSQIS